MLLSARGPLWSLRREGSHGTNLVGIAVPRPSDWRYRQALLLSADKALVAGYGISAGIVLGVLTAVGGGVIRDVIVGRVPAIFRASNFYAVCSLAGAVVYCLLVTNHMVKGWAALVSAAVVLSLRYLSLHYNWHTCAPIDLAQRYTQRHDACPDKAKDQEETAGED